MLDQIRDKLAVLTALTANSPYWRGLPTGFDSYRTQAWNRWPTSGPTSIFGTPHCLPAHREAAAGKRRDAGRGHDLLRRPHLQEPAHRGGPRSRRLPPSRGRRTDSGAGAGFGGDGLLELLDGVEPTAVPTALLRMAAGRPATADCAGSCWTSATSVPRRPRTWSGRWWTTWPRCWMNRASWSWPGKASAGSWRGARARNSSAGAEAGRQAGQSRRPRHPLPRSSGTQPR